jgi:hypothetical protein
VSCRVLVVPEDPTYNGAILKPLVERIVAECGRPNAKITVLTNPKASGFAHIKALMPEIAERYAHFDLLTFLPDADGKDRSAEFEHIEQKAHAKGARVICCAAVQEVETWLLAGHADKLGIAWSKVREDVSVKERVFEPFLQQYGDARRPAGGRDLLMSEALTNYNGILKRCPELVELQRRVCDVLQSA